MKVFDWTTIVQPVFRVLHFRIIRTERNKVSGIIVRDIACVVA